MRVVTTYSIKPTPWASRLPIGPRTCFPCCRYMYPEPLLANRSVNDLVRKRNLRLGMHHVPTVCIHTTPSLTGWPSLSLYTAPSYTLPSSTTPRIGIHQQPAVTPTIAKASCRERG